MVIQEVSAEQVLQDSRRALSLPSAESQLDDIMLAASVRRAAGINCPCSTATLAHAVRESLLYLATDEELADRISDTIEALTVGGDLLELNQVTTDDPDAKGSWVFAAPPGFVARPNGDVFLLGVVPDEASVLPPLLAKRILYRGSTRSLVPEPEEDLATTLRELELLEVSEAVWLKMPRRQTAKDFHDTAVRQLSAQSPSGEIAGLMILDSSRPVDYYRGRWIPAKGETGCYVARRPQAYGSPLWGIVLLEDGIARKFLDFPPRNTRWRGCDWAWQLQMAIDSVRGTPQRYRCRIDTEGARFDFYSPIPLWAERRLAMLGHVVPRERCLFSYRLPAKEIEALEAVLRERLWLARIE